MKKVWIIVAIVITLLILAGTALFLIGYYRPKPAGIRIESTPTSSVFINGELVGNTPFQGQHDAGEVVLRLVPLGSSENLTPFETSITLTSGIETVVGREFAATEDKSSNHIISFEKTSGQPAGIVVITQPGNAQVLIDGVSRGFSPYTTSTIAPAMHTIEIKSPEYQSFSMAVKTLDGYRMTFYAKLSKGEAEVPQEESTRSGEKVVTILDTPTGYLRVRSAPGTLGDEIAQVSPGETYPYLDTDVETGWIEIQYQASKSGLPKGITGWISDEYASISTSGASIAP